MHALDSYDELQIDMEVSLDLFGSIRPDVCIVERRPEIKDFLKTLKSQGHMHYLIEVKKLTAKPNESLFDNNFRYSRRAVPQSSKSREHLMNHLAQNMDQIRRFCLIEQEPEVYGILTNFRDWYFLKYTMKRELEATLHPRDGLMD